MKKIILSIFLWLLFSDLINAQNTVIGKITYEYISGSNIRLLDMWFTPQNYLYQYRKVDDPRDLPQFKNKKFKDVEDSVKFMKVIEQFNEGVKKMPIQSWFGQLGSNEVIYSSFDMDLKNYCIRDTMLFIKWELSEDTLTIKGIHCQKALGKFN